MSRSPSRPLDIGSPRRESRLSVPEPSDSPSPHPANVSGTPDLRTLRAQYTGTPPLPNIPPRSVAGTPRSGGSGLGQSVPRNGSSPSLQHKTSASPLAQRLSGLRDFQSDASGSQSRDLASQGGLSATRPDGSSSNDSSEGLTLDALPDEEKAKVLRRHLVSKDERERQSAAEDAGSTAGSYNGASKRHDDSAGTSRRSSTVFRLTREDTEPFPIPYQAPGADITHDVYKWHTQTSRRPRAASFAGSTAPQDPAFEHIHEPGGFRRNYVLLKANQQGAQPRILRSFIDFLYVYGHFAGEELDEDEDLEDIAEEDEGAVVLPGSSAPFFEGPAEAGTLAVDIESRAGAIGKDAHERTPLLPGHAQGRSKSRSRLRRASSVGPRGDATVTDAVLMLMKSFVGTGILFLGKAFMNGGLLFSVLTLSFIALISLYSFLLLVKTKFIVPGSFGDIGGELYGPWFRYAILTSITVSQLGFVSAYTIFVSENLQAFVLGITKCAKLISIPYFILMQLVIFLPMVLIRNLAKLSTAALVADAFIVAGLLYIFGSEVSIIADRGVADVALFNSKDFPLLIGTAVFSFEGIGLVIPISDAMREPRKFPAVLTGVMLFLMVLFGGGGALAYMTFGSDIKTVVITNLDQSSKMVQVASIVQFLYSIAILLSVPLQLFPAVRIMENGIFTRSGKGDTKVKWLKNVFRFLIVICCSLLAWAGAADLDKFVSFIGSFACVPLCYVYPAMLHYKVARTRRQRIADIALMIFGMAAAIYTTVQTVQLMVASGPGEGAPNIGECDLPVSGR
ncbi:hypothetical protein GLOTRDRAFT_78150 [Gloeophyllum trabeum ATCC 11539]|uniref:Amino acid transporter transmembrane domain-containing protein n=1 Tax=Gloeophyllum trabeum (strain ATCC 11539 / FP-39264 / Madison 617) TaxID=670483 RepID=S7Q3U9_GLOTA|nr:uncharacterized protein GLOTRDRAFT_78150 [Gloeophyllum trabeum ATCC 11539]EPQ54217.1 hypothetical protein GLOTRDRAFT_78150 [Gloeophyllum trabeum ATCC 11539]